MSNTKECIVFNREQMSKCLKNTVKICLLADLSSKVDKNDMVKISLRQAAHGIPKRKRNKRRYARTLRWMEREGMVVLNHPIRYKGLNEIKVTNHYDPSLEDQHEANRSQ